MAESDDDGAGQGRGIDQMCAAKLLGVGDGVGQDQAALGIGVQHLDGFAGHRGDDIAGPLRLAPGMFSTAGTIR